MSKKTSKKKSVSLWLIILSYVLVIAFIIIDYISNVAEFSSGVTALEITTWTVLGGIISIACGYQCAKWASKIKKNQNIAYAIGVIFSLIGWFFYWIYYAVKSKELHMV